MKKEREHLPSLLLIGESEGGTYKRRFILVKKLSVGSSAVCFEAYHAGSGRGVLKEFCPRQFSPWQRDGQGQLILPERWTAAYERFAQAERAYREPYEMLLAARQGEAGRELSTFIPEVELYRGCTEDGREATTYVWAPEPQLETFDRLCGQIHEVPGHQPELKLLTVLLAMQSLAKCICALHGAGMVHRDIKPANFGFRKRAGETLHRALHPRGGRRHCG